MCDLLSLLLLRRMKGAVRTLLECVGEDPERPGLLDTPGRVAKSLEYMTYGYSKVREETAHTHTPMRTCLSIAWRIYLSLCFRVISRYEQLL